MSRRKKRRKTRTRRPRRGTKGKPSTDAAIERILASIDDDRLADMSAQETGRFVAEGLAAEGTIAHKDVDRIAGLVAFALDPPAEPGFILSMPPDGSIDEVIAGLQDRLGPDVEINVRPLPPGTPVPGEFRMPDPPPRFLLGLEDGEYRVRFGQAQETRVHVESDGVSPCVGDWNDDDVWESPECRLCEDVDDPWMGFQCMVWILNPDDSVKDSLLLTFDAGYYRQISDLAIALERQDVDITAVSLIVTVGKPAFSVRVAS